MKTLFLSGILTCSFVLAFSQNEKLEPGDSINITMLSKELPLLRDSVSRFIRIVRVEIRKSPPSRKETLEKSIKELDDLRDKISSDLKEISQNKCTREATQRIKANTIANRNDFKRWTEMLMVTGEELSNR